MTRDLSLVWQQIRFQNRIFWRTPVAAFFTLVLPAFFLIIFTALFGNETSADLGGVTTAQFYAPALAVFSAVSATYTNIAIGTAISRDEGILKRVRGTPLPPWVYIAGRIGSGAYIAAIAVVLMLGLGVVIYGVEIIPRTLPAAAVTFAVGVAAFAALGVLVAAVAPSGDSAPAIANATLLPLAFVSDIFIPLSDPPAWVEIIGNIFPLKHFVKAFSYAFNPLLDGAQFHWMEIGVMAAWGVGAALLAAKLFRWEPTASGRSSRGRRRKAEAAAD